MIPFLPAVAGPRARWSLVALALLAIPACRTGTGPTPRAPSAPEPEFVRSYVGRAVILRHLGGQKQWSLDKKDVARQSATCDVGVEVKDAVFQKGVAQFRLEYLGRARVEGKRNQCRAKERDRPRSLIALQVKGFLPDEPPDAVTSVLDRLLMAPEALLAAHGIPFDVSPASEPSVVADRSPVAKPAEARLARDVTRWPRKLVWVEPAYADPARKVRHEGEMEFTAVVGSDGRLYGPSILTPLAEVHERQVKRALSLWRFEPARRAKEPVAVRLSERTTFRIY